MRDSSFLYCVWLNSYLFLRHKSVHYIDLMVVFPNRDNERIPTRDICSVRGIGVALSDNTSTHSLILLSFLCVQHQNAVPHLPLVVQGP